MIASSFDKSVLIVNCKDIKGRRLEKAKIERKNVGVTTVEMDKSKTVDISEKYIVFYNGNNYCDWFSANQYNNNWPFKPNREYSNIISGSQLEIAPKLNREEKANILIVSTDDCSVNFSGSGSYVVSGHEKMEATKLEYFDGSVCVPIFETKVSEMKASIVVDIASNKPIDIKDKDFYVFIEGKSSPILARCFQRNSDNGTIIDSLTGNTFFFTRVLFETERGFSFDGSKIKFYGQ